MFRMVSKERVQGGCITYICANGNEAIFEAPIDMEPGDKIDFEMQGASEERVMRIVRGRRIIYKRGQQRDRITLSHDPPNFTATYRGDELSFLTFVP